MNTLAFTLNGLSCNSPFAGLFAGDGLAGVFILAQSAQDISSVDPNFVKQFMTMLAYVLGVAALAGVGYVAGRKGTKGNPISIESPMDVNANVTHAPIHAHQSAVDELRQRMEALERANLNEHKAHREALATSFAELLAKGNARELSILTGQHEMETRMTTSILGVLNDIHDKMGPLSERVAGHSKAIQAIKEDLNRLWELVKPFLGLTSKTKK